MRLLLLLLPVLLYGQASTSGGNPNITGPSGSTPNPAVYLRRSTDQAGTDRYCRSSNGFDSYTCTVTPTLSAYTRGMIINLDPDTTNTGTASVNVNGVGTIQILTRSGAALADGDIVANRGVSLYYNGTTFNIVGSSGGAGAVASVFGRTGIVAAASGDYTASQVTNAADTTATYSNPAWISALAASKLTGLVPVANLGTGTANSTTCLYGDQTYKACGSGGSAPTAGTGILVVGTQVSINPAVTETLTNAQAGTASYCRSTTGSAAYACAMNPSLTAYTTGMVVRLNPNFANVTTATLNIDALGIKSLFKRDGTALTAADFPADKITLASYDGTAFNLVGDGGSGSAAGGSSGNLQYNNAGALGGLENTSRPNSGEVLFGTVPTASATRSAVGQGIALVGGSTTGTYHGINHSGGGFTGNWFNYQQGGVNQFRAMALMANGAPGMMITGSNFPAGGYGVCASGGNCSVIGVDQNNGLAIAHNTDGSFSTGVAVSFPRAGGIQLNANPGAKPVCAVASRGTAWFTFSAAATKDSYEICAKDAADVYAWRVIY